MVLLRDHVKEFPTELPAALCSLALGENVTIQGGDFTLQHIPTNQIAGYHLINHGHTGESCLLIRTYQGNFAYTMEGKEIANTLERNGKTRDHYRNNTFWELD